MMTNFRLIPVPAPRSWRDHVPQVWRQTCDETPFRRCSRLDGPPVSRVHVHTQVFLTLDKFLQQFPTASREMAITALETAKEKLLASIG
jgi:hypothetical protein